MARKHFVYVILNPDIDLETGALSPPFWVLEEFSSERLSHLLKITQLVAGGVRI